MPIPLVIIIFHLKVCFFDGENDLNGHFNRPFPVLNFKFIAFKIVCSCTTDLYLLYYAIK